MMNTPPPANHPLAWRMVGIAFLAQNVGIGLMFGSFGVLLKPVTRVMGVGLDAAVFGMPLVMIGMSLLAPVVGALSNRFRIRNLMILGAVLTGAGYIALSQATTIVQNWLAYALLVGPGLTFLSTVLPSALAARWFATDRGRALGIVNVPLFVMLTPLIAAALLGPTGGGLQRTYITMGVVALLLLPVLWLIVEHPPASDDRTAGDLAGDVVFDAGPTIPALLRSRYFWSLSIAAAAISCGGTLLSAHVVAMAENWGIEPIEAASLVAVMAGAGIAGSLAFGWLADRLGGARALMLNCLVQVLLWSLLLLRPPFPLMAGLIALIGVNASGIVSAFGTALTEHFGAESFGRAYGLSTLINLPFIAGGAPLAAALFVRTGSYAPAILAQTGFFVLGTILALSVGAKRSRTAATRE